MTHRVGIIGLGTVGGRFVEQFSTHPAFDLVAAWDPDDTARAAYAAAVTIVEGADEVIAAADVVYIAVPPIHHREYVESCVAAGTAIFCEKPLGVDVDESRDLARRVVESGLPAGVNFVFSAAPVATGLATAVSDREFGSVVRADLRLHFATWPRAWHEKAQWLRRRDQGGWIREVVSHFVFLAGRTLGPLTLDHAHVVFPDGTDGELCETDAEIRLVDRAGTPFTITGTSGGSGPDVVEFTVRGERGAARLSDWYHLQTANGGEWVEQLDDDRSRLAADAYRTQLDELDALLGRRDSRLATFDEALAVQELVEAALRVGMS